MKSFITAMVVMAVLGVLQRRTQKREQGVAEGVFLIKLSSKAFWLGLVEAGMMAAILVWGYLTRELNTGLTAIGVLTAVPGLMLMIGSQSGFWEILVDHNEIMVTKCFVFKKNFHFSDITHCIGKRGGVKVYVKGRKQKAFFVDDKMNGADLFEEKIMAAKIPVDGVVREESDELMQLGDGTMKKISKALDARDANALKKLFSESVIMEAEDIVQQISEFFEFYQGQIMICDGEAGVENIKEDGVKSCTSHYEILTSKRKYALRYEYWHGGEEHPEKTGLYKLEVQHIKISKGDVKQEVLWKNSFQKAGIYIQNNT